MGMDSTDHGDTVGDSDMVSLELMYIDPLDLVLLTILSSALLSIMFIVLSLIIDMGIIEIDLIQEALEAIDITLQIEEHILLEDITHQVQEGLQEATETIDIQTQTEILPEEATILEGITLQEQEVFAEVLREEVITPED